MKGAFLLLVLALLAFVLWRQAHPGVGPGEDGALPPTDRQRYVTATAEIICLGHQTLDPQIVADETRHIYRRHQFNPVMKYLDFVVRYEGDVAIRAEIGRRVLECQPHLRGD